MPFITIMLIAASTGVSPAGGLLTFDDPMPPHYVNQALAISADGEALLVGLSVTGDANDAAWSLDTWQRDARGQWQQLKPSANGESPAPRNEFRMVFDVARNQFILFGGRNQDGTPRNDTWVFKDGAWRSWSETSLAPDAVIPPPRYRFSMAYDEAREVTVLFGGRSTDDIRVNDTWEFDGTKWRLAQKGIPWDVVMQTPLEERDELFRDVPSPRYGSAMVYDPKHERIVLFGGYSPTGHDNDLWSYTVAGWQRIHRSIYPDDPTPTPRGSFGASMTFDQASGTILLSGGLFDDGRTWKLDGDTWTLLDEGNGPPGARMYPSLAFDPLAQAVILAGGGILGGEEKERAFTRWWKWDGTEWKSLDESDGQANE